MSHTKALRLLRPFFGGGAAAKPYRKDPSKQFNFYVQNETHVFNLIAQKALTDLYELAATADGTATTPNQTPSPSTPREYTFLTIASSPVLRIILTLFRHYPLPAAFHLHPGQPIVQASSFYGYLIFKTLPPLVHGLTECYMRGLVGPIGAVDAPCFRDDILQRDNIRGADTFGPVFIIGLVRSGTSIMHKMLSLDPAARAPRNFEFSYPSSFFSTEQRIASNNEDLMPGEQRSSEMEATEPAEDVILFSGVGGPAQVPASKIDSPRSMEQVMDWGLNGRDLVDLFCFHRLMVRLLEEQDHPHKSFQHWVFKDPSHILANLPAIIKVYPNARFVWMHRPIEDCLLSYVEPNCPTLPAFLDSFAEAFRRGLAFRKTGAYAGKESGGSGRDGPNSSSATHGSQEHRFEDVYLEDLVKNPVSVLEGLYRAWGKVMSEEHKASVQKWWGQNGRKPKSYSMDGENRALLASRSDSISNYLLRFPRDSTQIVVFSPEEWNRGLRVIQGEFPR